jgi:hypothetical protein
MKQIPDPENAPVLRTDFSNQMAWEKIRAEILKPVGIFHFLPNVEFIDDLEFANITKEQLLEILPTVYNHSFIIVADQTAMSNPEHPLLILDLFDRSAHEFRALPAQIQGIENNLSIANMDFEEFADSADEDGIFRGFPEDGQNPLP